MIQRLNRYEFYLRLVVYMLPAIAFGLAVAIRYSLPIARFNYGWRYAVLWIITSAIWLVLASHHHLYSVEHLVEEKTGLRRPVAATASLAAFLGLVLYMARDTSLSRVFIGASCLTLLGLTVVSRISFREFLRHVVGRKHPIRILMIGADQYARRAARGLRSTPFACCAVAGYIRLPEQRIAVRDAPVYEVGEIGSIDPAELDDVIIAVPFGQYEAVWTIMDAIRHLCRPLRCVVDLGGKIVMQTTPLRIGFSQMLDLGGMPVETVQYQFVKRLFDIMFALFALVAAGPVMALIALAIKVTSPGPVFFRQNRVGHNGKRFQMLKFRSMVVNGSSDTSHTSTTDPRVTSIGRILRKTSLDELPQFFNVLRGEMSVVGPRPELSFFVHRFGKEIPTYMSRHTIKCGITGWAQVNGLRGSHTSMATRVQYDLEYIRNWSLGLDLKIIFLTIISGFSSRNAF
jgi:putative colanic acid biosysnthesis UDP-glucose lipid carrier transferase